MCLTLTILTLEPFLCWPSHVKRLIVPWKNNRIHYCPPVNLSSLLERAVWWSLMKIAFLLAEWEIIRLNREKEEKALNLEGNGYINILINNWFERTEIITIRKTEFNHFLNYSSVNCFLIKTLFFFPFTFNFSCNRKSFYLMCINSLKCIEIITKRLRLGQIKQWLRLFLPVLNMLLREKLQWEKLVGVKLALLDKKSMKIHP